MYVQFVAGALNEWWICAPRFAGNKTVAAVMMLTAPLTGIAAAFYTHKSILSFF